MPDDPSDTIAAFASQMAFKKSWRPYQKRVLERLDLYLRDKHFHLVAAPGSGKTVLGLEVIRRLGRKTLVLAPSLAIREQWIDRLTNDYLDTDLQGDGDNIPWLSRDLSLLAELTISTYQALNSEFRKKSGTEVIEKLRADEVSVIVVDEAHHLRAVWWKCLAALKDALDDVVIIALTATPPIDVPQSEWNRYAGFCGKVDEEVGIPELVAAGNLCPHQDYVLFSTPDENDVAELRRFSSGVASFILDLQLDVEFAECLSEFPGWIADGELKNRKYLRENQEFFFALAIYFQAVAGRIPLAVRVAFGMEGEELPEVSIKWIEVLLQGLLYDFRERFDYAAGYPKGEDGEEVILSQEEKMQRSNAREIVAGLKRIRRRLYELGAIEKKCVVLTSTVENEKLLQNSPAKLHSIAGIVEQELVAQGVLMRAVVLTDYIRKDAFPAAISDSPVEEAPLVKLGVVPIFELLRRMRLPGLLPGILSGSLMVIPQSAEPDFRSIAATIGIEEENLQVRHLDHDEDFLFLEIRESDRHRAVAAVTHLFSQGAINCLVGTASLLGEGWDSPELNTLVLASVIGSFVMSNQMRGRAIRSSAENESKTANIWHVATIPPDLRPGLKEKRAAFFQYDVGRDYRKLQRRFEAFHGVGLELNEKGEALIESGMSRLGLGKTFDPEKLGETNQRMLECAEDRTGMEMIWSRAIPTESSGRFLRPIRALSIPPRMAASRFIVTLGGKSETGIRAALANWLEQWRLKGIARAILQSMRQIGEQDGAGEDFPGTKSQWKVRITRSGNRFHVTAPDLDSHLQGMFIESLDAFFDLFSNPRYLIFQKGRWFAIPTLLGGKRVNADIFSKNLRRNRFGRHKVFYAHGREGKDLLLEARKQSLLGHFDFRTESRVCWEAAEKSDF